MRPSLARDVSLAVVVLAALLLVHVLLPIKGFADCVNRCSSMALFATSLNMLVGYTGLVSFGHGMFFGLGAYGFGLIMQRTGLPVPVAFVATLVITTLVAG